MRFLPGANCEAGDSRSRESLLPATRQAAIVGGRNIGDHYFGLSQDHAFRDLDLLGFGEIASPSNGMFDHSGTASE